MLFLFFAWGETYRSFHRLNEEPGPWSPMTCAPHVPSQTMRAVAARRPQTPMRKRRVRTVRLQNVRKIHDRPSDSQERVRQPFDIGDGSNQKPHVGISLGMLPSDMAEAPVTCKKLFCISTIRRADLSMSGTLAHRLHRCLPRSCSSVERKSTRDPVLGLHRA
jgi:hypothetical protein